MGHSLHSSIFGYPQFLILATPMFPPNPYLTPPQKGFPLELDNGSWAQNWIDGATWLREKFDDIFSRLDTIHKCDGQTDTDRQLVQRLRIASRSKKKRWVRQKKYVSI